MQRIVDFMVMRYLNTAFLAAVLSLQACDEKPSVKDELLPPMAGTRQAVLCNEGNFQWGNADITVFDTDEQVLVENAFSRANNKPLGDVCQSAYYFDNKVFLVVNNSQKIEVISPTDFKVIQTISGFHSPRYITWVSTEKAYVSEYYANSIKVINPLTGNLAGSIGCPGWHDEMLLTRGKLYITTVNRDKLYILDEQTNELRDSIALTYGSNSMVTDAQDKLWVLCTGDAVRGTSARLYKINTAYDTIERVIRLNKPSATRLCINKSRNRIYWIADDVYTMDASDSTSSPAHFIYAQGRIFYGLDYNIHLDELWVSDAIDYTQRSVVYRYRMDGTPAGQFKAGINTGNMLFYEK